MGTAVPAVLNYVKYPDRFDQKFPIFSSKIMLTTINLYGNLSLSPGSRHFYWLLNHTRVWLKETEAPMQIQIPLNGLAFVIMTLASTIACTIAYVAGKQAAVRNN
jgi:hypothetical protein